MYATALLPEATRVAHPWAAGVRPATGADRGQLRRLLLRLSLASKVSRFHGQGLHPSDELLDVLLCGGLPGRALVTELGARIVGHAVWHPLRPRPEIAEIAVLVDDPWQRCGLGTVLGRAALDDAAAHGVTQVVLPVAAGHRAGRRLVARLLPRAVADRHQPDVVDYHARIAP